MKFRRIPKERFNALIPVELARALRIKAAEQGRPENVILTEVLCASFDLDPSKFGVQVVQSSLN